MHGRPEKPADRKSSWVEMMQFVLCVAATLGLARLLVEIPQGPARTSLLLLLYAGSACLSSILVSSASSSPSGDWTQALYRSAATVLVFLAAVAADSGTRATLFTLLPLSIMLFLIVSAMNTALLALPGTIENHRLVLFAIVTALFTIPIWLGPMIVATGNSPALTNVVVAVSPLTAFAVSIDLDYLRTAWFYEFSPLGALRYTYASWLAYVIVLALALAALATTAPNILKTRKQP